MSNQEKNEEELETYVNRLDGHGWQGLALAQYAKSIASMSHDEAMNTVYNKIVEVASRIIDKSTA